MASLEEGGAEWSVYLKPSLNFSPLRRLAGPFAATEPALGGLLEVDIRAELHECDKLADIVRELVRSGETRDALGVIEEMPMPIAEQIERLIVEEDESVLRHQATRRIQCLLL